MWESEEAAPPTLMTPEDAGRVIDELIDTETVQTMMGGAPLWHLDLYAAQITDDAYARLMDEIQAEARALAEDQGLMGPAAEQAADLGLVSEGAQLESAARLHHAIEFASGAHAHSVVDPDPELVTDISLGRNERIPDAYWHYLADQANAAMVKHERPPSMPFADAIDRVTASSKRSRSPAEASVADKKRRFFRRAAASGTPLSGDDVRAAMTGDRESETEPSTFQMRLSDSLRVVFQNRGDITTPFDKSVDVWVPAIEFLDAAKSRRACFDLVVTPNSAPGAPPRTGPRDSRRHIQVRLRDGMAYREIQLAQVLGAGAFGVVVRIHETALKDTLEGSFPTEPDVAAIESLAALDSSWEPESQLAMKITLQRERLLAGDRLEQNLHLDVTGAIGEFIIGRFINLMFLDPLGASGMAMTPNVTRTEFGFACQMLPPSGGQWAELYDAVDELVAQRGADRQPQWDRATRNVRGWDPRELTVVYSAAELADLGDLWSAMEATAGYLAYPEMVQSMTFQGVYTIAAFAEYGFLHQDIKPSNMGLRTTPASARYIYHLHSPDGHGDALRFDPLHVQWIKEGGNRLQLKFLDYGNYDLAHHTVTDEPTGATRKVFRHVRPRGTIVYTAPEAYMLPRIEGRAPDQWTPSAAMRPAQPEFSTASDVWSFALSIVALVVPGSLPMLSHHAHPTTWPKRKKNLWKDMRRALLLTDVRASPDARVRQLSRWWSHLAAGFATLSPTTRPQLREITRSAFTMLYDMVEMIGFPWLDPVTGHMSEAMNRKFLASGAYPFVEVLWKHQAAFSSTAGDGGWLRRDDNIRRAFVLGSDDSGLRMLLRMLAWDPAARADPHQLLLEAAGLDPRRPGLAPNRFFSDMLVTRDEYRELRDAFYVSDYGWRKGRPDIRLVRMVDKNQERLERQLLGSSSSSSSDDASSERRRPTFTTLPAPLARAVAAEARLEPLFGRVHPDDTAMLVPDPADADWFAGKKLKLRRTRSPRRRSPRRRSPRRARTKSPRGARSPRRRSPFRRRRVKWWSKFHGKDDPRRNLPTVERVPGTGTQGRRARYRMTAEGRRRLFHDPLAGRSKKQTVRRTLFAHPAERAPRRKLTPRARRREQEEIRKFGCQDHPHPRFCLKTKKRELKQHRKLFGEDPGPNTIMVGGAPLPGDSASGWHAYL